MSDISEALDDTAAQSAPSNEFERLTKVNDADVVEEAVRQLLGEGSALSVLYTLSLIHI